MKRTTSLVLFCLGVIHASRSVADSPPAPVLIRPLSSQGAKDQQPPAELVEVPLETLADDPDRATDNDDVSADQDEPPSAELPDFDLPPLEEFAEQSFLVPGPLPATLTAVDDDLPIALPAGYVLPSISRYTPAAVTRIDEDMILASGARRLTELMDIYVPNTQIVKHHFSFEHLTPRGLVSDLEDKYLYLVNGKNMNHQTITGSFSEVRDLPLLGDFHHIDFVRGPGSALYGPGAISGVISANTHSAMTFEGTDATLRQGAIDTFTTFELRHGRKFSEDSGIFAYFGIADYQGAGYADAPLKFSKSFATPNSIPDVIAGQRVTVPSVYPDDRKSWRSRAKMKLHTQYTKGNFDFWVRYTQGGEQATPQRGEFALPPFGGRTPGFDYNTAEAFQFGYVQLTVFSRYLWEISENFNAEFRLSYDSMDFSRFFDSPSAPARVGNPQREEEFYGRMMFNWTINDRNESAFGFELSRGHFGLGTWSFPDAPASTIINGTTGIPWWTTGYAFIGEHQWQVNDCWTLFATGRWDNHTYTDTLFSPRGAIVYTPDDVNTLKFIATESVRRLPEDVLYGDAQNNRARTDVESIKSLELRYERRSSEELLLAASGFYQDSKFVGLNGVGNSNQGQFADVTMAGVELEAIYRTGKSRLIASQSYTGLIDFELVGPFALPDPFDLADPFFQQRISAAPYGFGNELANQSPHLTKLAIHRQHDRDWSSDASLRVYWGFPGDEDLTEYDNARFAAQGSANRVSDPGFVDAFKEALFLNYALNYRHNSHITARMDLYNILGWFDDDLNKRNFIFQPTTYRDDAAALGVTVRVTY